MKYIKKFELIDNYSIWKNSDNYIAPNVSMIDNDDEDDIINYNPLIIINPSVTMNDWTYGETASNPVISGNTGNGTVTYLYKVSSADDSTYTSTKPTDAGTYTIKANINAIRDYSAGSCTSTFTISKANINPSVTIEDWNEGDTASNPVISGNTGNGTVTYMYKVSSADDSTYTSTVPNTEGTYTIKATIGATSNYNGATCTTTFTIIKVNNNKIITYTASSKLPETTTTYYNGLHTNAFITTIKSHIFENGIGTIEFNDDVTSIGAYAFYQSSGLTSITIPNTVTSIGNNAFRGCFGLTSITIPDSVTSIGEDAFQGCSGLTTITIPDSVVGIGDGVFGGCSGLISITVDSNNKKYNSRNNCNAIIETSTNKLIAGCNNTIMPDSVTSIGKEVFSGCSGLTSITIPNTVTSIGDKAFSGCSGLTSITIPNTVTSMGIQTFQGCTGLTSITIPNTVTSMGIQTFQGCTGLTSVTIGSGITIIGQDTFSGCSGLTSVTIPDSVTSIGNSAFFNCSGLTSVIIGNSVTSINYQAFYNCSGLTSITIPDSVTSIGNSAFFNCSGLTSVTIGNSVTSIGEGAFKNCSKLTSIISNRYYAPSIQSNTFQGIARNGILTPPLNNENYGNWMSKNSYYLGFYNWTYPIDESYNNIYMIEATYDVTSTSSSTKLLNDSTKIIYMEVDGEEKSVSSSYQFNSTGFHTVKFITRDLSKIGTRTFNFCSNLKSIIIPSGIKTIESYAFSSCTNLTYIKCNGTTAPYVYSSSAFNDCGKCGILVVSSSNSGYDTMISYLGSSVWEKVIDNGTFGTQELTGLYWSKDSITVTSNYASLPTLTKPSGITITYASSNTSKATINSSGTVTIKGSTSSDNDGSTIIMATFSGNSTYKPKRVGYTLTIDMYTPPSSGGGSYGGGE